MDLVDAKILREVQSDAGRSMAEIAESLAMSTSAYHRRLKALEQSGAISGYAAVLNSKALGLRLQAFVEIRLSDQSQQTMDRFEEAANSFDEILSCHLLSGDADYMLRIAARDLDHFDRLHRDCLAKLPSVSSIKSSFSIREVKAWSGYPVSFA